MSVLQYEDYSQKDRISDWTGPLPSHWHSRKLKFVADCFASNIDKKSKPGELPIRLCNYTDVYYNDEISEDLEFMRATATSEQIDKFLLRAGDTIITKDSEDPNDIAVPTFVPETLPGVICAYHLSMIRPTSSMHPKFLNWAFQASYARSFFATRANGLTRYGLGAQALGEWDVPVPTPPEQKQIASFLDYETAKIDALIEKQQQLIALLGEKRQAVISHAVTKGLNPDAPMRDSGVEWLGEVPSHWEVSKFGYVSSVVRGGSPRPAGDPTLFDGDYSPWVTVAEVTKDNRMELTETSSFLTKKGSAQSRLFQPGTLLLSNSGATLGVPKILMIQANANDGVVGFEQLRHNREFCYFYLASLTENLRERIKQGSGQPNLNTDIVKHIELPIPPDQETKAIVAHVVEQLEKLAKLVDRAGDAMELLRERRTALISAAVTGKIDVRGWKPPSTDSHKLETEMEVA